jgi:preprotein translocase subunit SecG
MFLVAGVDWLHYVFTIPLSLLSVFLILVILVQRGRGGGLTGALGGMGGQSAFGTKAGDLFTRITIIVAAIWVLLSMASLKILSQRSERAGLNPEARGMTAPKTPAGGKGAAFIPDSAEPATTTAPPSTSDSKSTPASGDAGAPATGNGPTSSGTAPSGGSPPSAPGGTSDSGTKTGNAAKP